MKKFYGIFAAVLVSSTCYGMDKKEILQKVSPQAVYHLAKKGAPLQKFYPLVEREKLPEGCMTYEEALQKGYLNELCKHEKNCALYKEEIPNPGFWDYAKAWVTWSETPENRDWQNPLKIDDFDGIFGWNFAPNRFIRLMGEKKFILFDTKTNRPVVTYNNPEGNKVRYGKINGPQTHCAVIPDKDTNYTAYMYDLEKGRRCAEVPFDKTCRFVQTDEGNNFVIVNNDRVIAYEIIGNQVREVAIVPLPSTTAKKWYWATLDNADAVIVECENGAVYFINPHKGYSRTQIEYKDQFKVIPHNLGKPYFFVVIDDEVRLYDAKTGTYYAGKIEMRDMFEESVHAVNADFTKFALKTASCQRNGIVLYDVKDKKPVFIDLAGDDRKVMLAQYSSDGTYFSYVLYDTQGSTWRCHATKDGTLLGEKDFEKGGYSYVWVPQSSFFVLVFVDTVFVFDAKSGRSELIEYKNGGWLGEFRIDDAFGFALQKKEQEGTFYTFKGNEMVQKNFGTEAPFTMIGSCFNPKGTQFVVATEKNFYVYDVVSGRFIKKFDQEQNNKVQSFDFSRSAYFVALGTANVKVFKQENFELLHTLSFNEIIKDGGFIGNKNIFIVRTDKGPLYCYYMHYGQLIELKK